MQIESVEQLAATAAYSLSTIIVAAAAAVKYVKQIVRFAPNICLQCCSVEVLANQAHSLLVCTLMFCFLACFVVARMLYG